MNDLLDSTKREIRRVIRRRQATLFSTEKRRASEVLARHLNHIPEYVRAHRIGLYAAFGDELPTQPIFDAAVGAGKEVALPAVDGSSLRFRLVRRWEDLSPGFRGILEPIWGRAVEAWDLDILFVPGMAFDRSRRRLGRGGGFYDRLLVPGRRSRMVVGVGYSFQIVASIPVAPHDRPMDLILTDRGPVR